MDIILQHNFETFMIDSESENIKAELREFCDRCGCEYFDEVAEQLLSISMIVK